MISVEKLIVPYVIGLLMRELDKYKAQIDWSKLKAEVDEKIRAMIPGGMFDDEVVKVVNAILDEAAKVLAGDDQLKAILDLLAAQKWAEAGSAVVALLVAAVEDVAAKAALVKFQG